jgi:diguanylate cyclase (GGDEF)-like protein
MRLLIVEDDAADAALTVRQLEVEGIHCTWTRVTTEAAFREALVSTPDLIISDCTLPGFDGLSAFSIAASQAPQIPFVFVSGTLGDERAHEALKAGAAGYIAKGDRQHLMQVVRSALQPHPSPRRRVTERGVPLGDADPGTGAAQHLSARRAVLDDTLSQQDSSVTSAIPHTAAPISAALVVIEETQARKRFAQLLTSANIEVDVSDSTPEALERLACRVHALLFTDSLELIHSARQLPSGAATHIVFMSCAGSLLDLQALRAGANDCMPRAACDEHFWAHLTTALRIADLTACLQRLTASLQGALQDNCMLSSIDELTRAGSRRFFEQHFPREVERAARLGSPLAIVMCDIDHFKRINDSHGHLLGDQVLRMFVERISHSLRLGKDWIARLGGEEFAVVLPDTSASKARAIANRLRERIGSEAFALLPGETSITASFGVCALNRVPSGCPGLAVGMVSTADDALYQSKHQGRNRVTARYTAGVQRSVRSV